MSVIAIVLAGGAAARFGGDKLAAELDGRPLLHHALEACAAIAPTIVLVLAPGAPVPPIPATLEPGVRVARDRAAYRGPLAGLAAGLEAATLVAPDADVAVLVGGDMPALVPDVLRLLVERLVAPDVPGTPGIEAAFLEAEPAATLPLAVSIPAAGRAAGALLDANRRSLRALLGRLHATQVDAASWRALDPDGRTILDVDAPEDLAAASARGE